MGTLDGKTILVTGANAGIGRESALEFARRGAHVVLLCRSVEKGEAALNAVRQVGRGDLVQCDLASLKSVDQAAKEVLDRFDRLDVLLNNAGLFVAKCEHSVDGFELTFATNHLGPFLLTSRLLDRLKATKGARIINVSSEAHRTAIPNLDDVRGTDGYNAMVAYGNSKLFNICHANALARRLKDDDVTANSLHPGVVKSNFGGEKGWMSAFYKVAAPFIKNSEDGAATSIFLATSPSVAGVTGKFFANCKPRQPRKRARDEAFQEQLWTLSESLIEESLGGR